MKFNPNQLTFDQGLQRIQDVVGKNFTSDTIVTSRDMGMDEIVRKLNTDNVPEGFSKWQLPVSLDSPSQFFLSFGAPNLSVPEHSHDEGDGMRIILHGSIEYDGRELGPGDWMFIPKGKAYQFNIGPKGVGMAYCYSCCCA